MTLLLTHHNVAAIFHYRYHLPTWFCIELFIRVPRTWL